MNYILAYSVGVDYLEDAVYKVLEFNSGTDLVDFVIENRLEGRMYFAHAARDINWYDEQEAY